MTCYQEQSTWYVVWSSKSHTSLPLIFEAHPSPRAIAALWDHIYRINCLFSNSSCIPVENKKRSKCCFVGRQQGKLEAYFCKKVGLVVSLFRMELGRPVELVRMELGKPVELVRMELGGPVELVRMELGRPVELVRTVGLLAMLVRTRRVRRIALASVL